MKQIKIGEPVIINEFDRPCTRLIAVVSKIEGGKVYARYLTTGTMKEQCFSSQGNVTAVKDFGVELSLVNGMAKCTKTGDSVATYHDGTPRKWQPEAHELYPCRRNVAAMVSAT